VLDDMTMPQVIRLETGVLFELIARRYGIRMASPRSNQAFSESGIDLPTNEP